MKEEHSPTQIFENDKVTFKSYINEFTSDLYKEFDQKAEKLELRSKIDDLYSGKKVNYTEGLAAWHTKYRDKYNPNACNTPSNKNQQKT